MSEVASHYQGQVDDSGMGPPSMRARIGQLDVEASFYSTGGKHPELYSQLDISLPPQLRLPRLRLSAPEGWLTGLGKALGMQDIELGDSEFDALFLVKGQPAPRVQEVLDEPARKAATQLHDLVTCQSLEVLHDRGEVRIRKRHWYERASAWISYIDDAVVLVSALCASADRWWLDAAAELGLEPGHRDALGSLTLEGVLEDVAVHAQVEEDSDYLTRIDAAAPSPFSAWHKDHAPRRVQAFHTGNPVVDHMLVIQTDQPEATRSLLADEALVQSLLEVVHGHPGSVVHADGVVLRVQGWLHGDGLLQSIHLAARLGAHLTRLAP